MQAAWARFCDRCPKPRLGHCPEASLFVRFNANPDLFGLDISEEHRFSAEAITDTAETRCLERFGELTAPPA